MKTSAADQRDGFLALDGPALTGQCEVHTYRASGPGGQKRNKTDSAVRLKHLPTGVTVVATESRSQHENRARAIRRLRFAIALHIRRAVNLDSYGPSGVLDERARSGRLVVSTRHADFNLVVAEVLDVLSAAGGRVSTCAKAVGLSTAAFVAFLQSEPKLWAAANHIRAAADLPALR